MERGSARAGAARTFTVYVGRGEDAERGGALQPQPRWASMRRPASSRLRLPVSTCGVGERTCRPRNSRSLPRAPAWRRRGKRRRCRRAAHRVGGDAELATPPRPTRVSDDYARCPCRSILRHGGGSTAPVGMSTSRRLHDRLDQHGSPKSGQRPPAAACRRVRLPPGGGAPGVPPAGVGRRACAIAPVSITVELARRDSDSLFFRDGAGPRISVRRRTPWRRGRPAPWANTWAPVPLHSTWRRRLVRLDVGLR